MSEKSDIGLGWNYRVVHHPPSKYKIGDQLFDSEEYLAIHEVYYNKNNEVNMMTVDPIVVGDETIASLKWILEHQLECLEKPILAEEITDGIFKEISQEKQDEFSKSTEDKK